MKLMRWALAAMLGVSAAGLRAADAPPATVAPPQKNTAPDPSAPMPKGNDEKSKKDFLGRHEGFLKDKEALLAKGPIQFVAIGDSITDGWRGQGRDVWKETFGPYNAYNIGIGGDQTQHVLWRLDNGELDGINPNPKVAMIMNGTNNLGNRDDEAMADR